MSGESPFLVESQPANERELHLLIGFIRIPDFGSSSQFARFSFEILFCLPISLRNYVLMVNTLSLYTFVSPLCKKTIWIIS